MCVFKHTIISYTRFSYCLPSSCALLRLLNLLQHFLADTVVVVTRVILSCPRYCRQDSRLHSNLLIINLRSLPPTQFVSLPYSPLIPNDYYLKNEPIITHSLLCFSIALNIRWRFSTTIVITRITNVSLLYVCSIHIHRFPVEVGYRPMTLYTSRLGTNRLILCYTISAGILLNCDIRAADSYEPKKLSFLVACTLRVIEKVRAKTILSALFYIVRSAASSRWSKGIRNDFFFLFNATLTRIEKPDRDIRTV